MNIFSIVLANENVAVQAVDGGSPLHYLSSYTQKEAAQTLIPQLFGKPCMMQYSSNLGYKPNALVVVSGVASFHLEERT